MSDTPNSSDPALPFPEILNNGADTNLVDIGGACTTFMCDAFSVSVMLDRQAFLREDQSAASYLVVSRLEGRDDAGRPISRIVDAVTVDAQRQGQVFEVFGPTYDNLCSLPVLPAGVQAVAAEHTAGFEPATPTRLWIIDPTEGSLAELPPDPSWTCASMQH